MRELLSSARIEALAKRYQDARRAHALTAIGQNITLFGIE